MIVASQLTFSGQFWCLSGQTQFDLTYLLNIINEKISVFIKDKNVQKNINFYHKQCVCMYQLYTHSTNTIAHTYCNDHIHTHIQVLTLAISSLNIPRLMRTHDPLLIPDTSRTTFNTSTISLMGTISCCHLPICRLPMFSIA